MRPTLPAQRREYQTLPSVYGAIGIVLALAGSTLMVYSDEKRNDDASVRDADAVAPSPDATQP